MSVKVTKMLSGQYKIEIFNLDSENTRKLDEMLGDLGYQIERTKEEPKKPRSDEDKLRKFYENK